MTEWNGIHTVWTDRPDGSVLKFNLIDGVYAGRPNLLERLTRTYGSGGQPTGWSLDTGSEVETYDSAGRLTSITSRSGVAQTLAYGPNGFPQSVTDNHGNSLSFTYASNRIASITNPAGGVYVFGFQNGLLKTVQYPDSTVRQYQYNSSSLLTNITDESGTSYATFSYFSLLPQATEHSGGVLKYTISTGGTSRTVTDPLGVVRNYVFQTIQGTNRLVSEKQPNASGTGTVTRYLAYDANANAISAIDFGGNRICHAYDPILNLENVRIEGLAAGIACPGNLATYTPTVGTRQRKKGTQWHATLRVPTQIDEIGKRTTYTHDANGNVLTKTVLDTTTSESRTWAYTYMS